MIEQCAAFSVSDLIVIVVVINETVAQTSDESIFMVTNEECGFKTLRLACKERYLLFTQNMEKAVNYYMRAMPDLQAG